MKKSLLFFMGSCMLFSVVTAQENRATLSNDRAQRREVAMADSTEQKEVSKKDTTERKNFFVGIGVQGDVYLNNDSRRDFSQWGKPTFGGKAFLGKWFNQYLGGRIVLEMGQLKPTFQDGTWVEDEMYVLGRLDLLFDLTNCFRSYSPNRFYNLNPYVGIGAAKAFNAHNRPDGASGSSTYVLGGGLLNTFRISEKFSVFLNLGMDLVEPKFDGDQDLDSKVNGIVTGTVGMIMNF